eukprot:scaffold41428_cov19-Tisochrysis_lutea.AAC.1
MPEQKEREQLRGSSIGFTRRAGATRVTHKSLLDLLRADPQAIPCMVRLGSGATLPGCYVHKNPLMAGLGLARTNTCCMHSGTASERSACGPLLKFRALHNLSTCFCVLLESGSSCWIDNH